VAARAFHYLADHFMDDVYGGVFWTVDYKGAPLDAKKQIYALAFAMYGFSEYHRVAGDENAKQLAIQLYKDIVLHSYDEKNGGYIEALTRDWKEIKDARLSEKDANEPKSMNTHLHVLEGFASLYRCWPDETLKQRLKELVEIFLSHIISESGHLDLFFNDEWHTKHEFISYGHDIEAAWLVQEAAELINDKALLEKVKVKSIHLADAATEGLDSDGGLWYEYDLVNHELIKQKHSWPQAEAMVGFFNAWQITGAEKYLHHSLNSWEFVKHYLLDKNCGEWYWGVNEDHSPMKTEDKAGIWKCPYHNSRACMEIINRVNSILNNGSI
jgi:mannobiose 2-epimerase